MPRHVVLFALLSILLTGLAHGRAQAQDLYAGTVAVAGQGVAERQAVLPAALRQVLQKLSGERELPPGPALDGALSGAAGMLRSFQYIEWQATTPEGGAESELRLVAQFSPAAVDGLMRALQLPRWRPERKPIVLWVMIDDGRGRQLQPLEYQYAWDRVEDVAAGRGLPVAWPGLSEELKQTVDLQLLWGGYTDQLLLDGSASDGVVAVAARREGPEWNLRWTFSDASATSSWRTRNLDLSAALVDGVHQLTDLVASIHSLGPAGQGQWQEELRVTGLRNRDDYVQCLDYLQDLSLVEAVAITRAGESGVGFRLDLNAEPSYLHGILSRGGRVERDPDSGQYRWLP